MFNLMVYKTGMMDFFRYRPRCPVYWRGKDEEAVWQQGFDYMNNYNKEAV